jgi:hypothetical protein
VRDLTVIEAILRDRRSFFLEIRDGIAIRHKIRAMLVSSVLFFALYGAVLGSQAGVLQALSSAVKLPILFLATLLVCAPTLYFFHLLLGAQQGLAQTVALMLTAITVTAVLLLSFTPIALFFLLTTAGYQFFKVLNVGVFAVCGVVGVYFLSQGLAMVAPESGRGRGCVTWLWVVLYAFVGCQMAWTLRPFIGAPSMPFELFRHLGGNFYADVFASLGEVFGLHRVY